MASTAVYPSLLQSQGKDTEVKKQDVREISEAAPQRPHRVSYSDAWAEAVARYGDKEAFVFDGVGPELRFTYNDLEQRSNRLARNLIKDFGLQAGDNVVTVVNNRPDVVTLMLALLKMGAVFIPLATDLRLQDCRTVVSVYEPKLVVCDQPQYMPFMDADGGEYTTVQLPDYRAAESPLSRMELEGDDAPLPAPECNEEPAIIFSTSGSTGLPKGVIYSRNLMGRMAAERSTGCSEGNPGDKNLLWVHFRGVIGTLVLLTQVLNGVEQILVDAYPNGPRQWAPLIEKHQVTTMMLFGAAMNQMLQELPGQKFASVKSIGYGGSCFPPTLVQKGMEQFHNAAFRQVYGMTETFPISALPPSFHKSAAEASAEDLAKMSSAGFPLGHVFIEDMDKPGSGLPPPPSKEGVGQICACSDFNMSGYYQNPEKTKETMPDGKYVRTGDVGKIGEDGLLYILGRVKDIIPTYRGFNVAPRDIEEVLYTHPAVGQAQVIGLLHPCGAGDMVVVWANAKDGNNITPEELKAHCESAGLPSWQTPEVFNVTNKPLPTNGSKLNKKALQEPSFVRAALLVNLREGSHITQMSAEDQDKASSAFRQLDVDGSGHLTEQALRPVFDESSTDLITACSSELTNGITMQAWLTALSKLSALQRASWLFQLGSLLALAELAKLRR
eukprot:TRINITY_DN90457_c0_g1_i1.p1 TRINITY_DN90457_c0_g1~~TRINITY_DN90457_c0_g1_i1.p1  ORF type:complete len:669 (+),score=114.67 TRINITY_DN90457_c0_g1_i1:71-2077(+)